MQSPRIIKYHFSMQVNSDVTEIFSSYGRCIQNLNNGFIIITVVAEIFTDVSTCCFNRCNLQWIFQYVITQHAKVCTHVWHSTDSTFQPALQTTCIMRPPPLLRQFHTFQGALYRIIKLHFEGANILLLLGEKISSHSHQQLASVYQVWLQSGEQKNQVK